MKLIDLISYFRLGGTFEEFCELQELDIESECIEIYAQKPVNLESRLGFFSVNETKGRIEFQSKGMQYQNLFDFFYFLDVIEDVKGNEHMADTELAQTLLLYALKDA